MRRRGERGETLAEILVSTTLLGIIGVGIIGAIASVLISTDIDRKTSAGETVIRSYAAAVQRTAYQPCPGADYSPGTIGFTEPAHFTVKVVGITAWDGTGPVVVPTTDPAPTQPSELNLGTDCNAATDHGLQQIVLQADAAGSGGGPSDRNVPQRLVIVKRDPLLTTTTSAP